MGLKKTLAVLAMVVFSWLLVIGTVYGAFELYQLLVPGSETSGVAVSPPF